MSAKTAKNNFGELIDSAQKEPVEIQKNGRSVAVLVSVDEFRRLEALEDRWWANEADKASKEGFAGVEATEKFLAGLLNAKD